MIAEAHLLPACGDAVLLETGFLVEAHHLDRSFQTDALHVVQRFQRVFPQATPHPLALILRLHHKQADEGIAGVVSHRSDATRRLVV